MGLSLKSFKGGGIGPQKNDFELTIYPQGPPSE